MTRTATRPATNVDPSAPASGLRPLSAEEIADQTDAGSFKRGQSYYRSHRIFDAIRRENTIRARCRGSSGGPYLVEATLAAPGEERARNPLSYSCDCPRGGFCKHVVALLLTWLNEPETFAMRPPLSTLLANQDREALVALIEKMVKSHPELEELLEIPASETVTMDDAPIDETALRRQVAATIPDEEDYDDRYWDYGQEIYGLPESDLAKLERIVSLAEAYVDVGHWQNVHRAAATLVEELAPHYSLLQDESGDVDALILRCDRALALCLEIQDRLPEERRLTRDERLRLVDALLRIWETDLTAGGLDLSQYGPEAISRAATAEERERGVETARDALASQYRDAVDRTWEKQAAIALLDLMRGGAGFSDEELLAEYRNAGLWKDASSLLVRMGQVDEALAMATRRLSSASALTALADQVLEQSDSQLRARVIALVDDRLWENEGKDAQNDQVLRGWLERRHVEQGDLAKALELARDRFAASPTKAVYDDVRQIALHPDQPGSPWPALRKELMATLKKRGDWGVIIDIQLDDGEIGEAIASLEAADKARRSGMFGSPYGWSMHRQAYTARVAAAAETSHPAQAVKLYQRMADASIAARNRESYRQAAAHLSRIRQILEAAGQADEWPPLISSVREQNRTLRALREELDALELQ